MQYLLMIYSAENAGQARTEAEMKAMRQAYGDFTESIVKSGNFLAGDALQSISTATTVRLKDGKTMTMDGPFAETKEQLGGYYLVEARDLDEAIAIASRIPVVKYGGCVEVRPLRPSPKVA